jgi:hypothetical protein
MYARNMSDGKAEASQQIIKLDALVSSSLSFILLHYTVVTV